MSMKMHAPRMGQREQNLLFASNSLRAEAINYTEAGKQKEANAAWERLSEAAVNYAKAKEEYEKYERGNKP